MAREAGVSLKTASRVLNDSPELLPATAARVRKAMDKLGYQPNEMARGLKAKRSGAIAMILPNLADPFTATAVQAVQEVARQKGYVVILAVSGGYEAIEESELQAMARRQIDGILLVAANSRKNNIKPFLEKKIPVVVFDEPIRGERIDSITVTNSKGTREATEHLLDHGYRRILAVGARPNLFTCAERFAGYRSAMKKAGVERAELALQHENDLTPEILSNFLSGPKPVEAILTLNWVCTMLTLRALKVLNKVIAKDVALISFDDFELADLISPGLTVVRQPTRELGHQAAKILFERMAEKTNGEPRKVVLGTEFIIRGSCGCGEKRNASTGQVVSNTEVSRLSLPRVRHRKAVSTSSRT
ncbi:MAG: LacI family DNA-binding transcriptional regulator [Edaphobacter sp.]